MAGFIHDGVVKYLDVALAEKYNKYDSIKGNIFCGFFCVIYADIFLWENKFLCIILNFFIEHKSQLKTSWKTPLDWLKVYLCHVL